MKITNTLLILGLVASYSIGYHASNNSVQVTPYNENYTLNTQDKPRVAFGRFQQVLGLINQNYIYLDEVSTQNIEDTIVKGLVAGLEDDHSSYLTPEESKIFMENLDQNLVGIGAELTIEDGIIYVVTPLVSSPAEKAGLLPEDVIISVDGEDITQLNLLEVIQKIRGEKGTSVTLGILRSETDPFEITIVRDVINLDSVTHEDLEDDIFYIRINQFSNDTSHEFKTAATKALLDQPKGIILDLRFNGGGYLESAIEILGEFLDKDQVAVSTQKQSDQIKNQMTANGTGRLQGIPVVVLINKGSASASEILAGTLQDYDIATIIGENSYGKGSVQEVIPFKDGAHLKLTVAKWLTAKGRDIDKVGLKPDIEISISKEDLENEIDRQLEEAKLYLKELKIADN